MQTEAVNHEDIERVRQAIMRFNELLTIMRQNLADGERMYAKLFTNVSAETKANTAEKQLQWLIASQMVDNTDTLRRNASTMQFFARDLERNFEQLHDILVDIGA
jgi:hypothetical protein